MGDGRSREDGIAKAFPSYYFTLACDRDYVTYSYNKLMKGSISGTIFTS